MKKIRIYKMNFKKKIYYIINANNNYKTYRSILINYNKITSTIKNYCHKKIQKSMNYNSNQKEIKNS